MSCLTLCDPMSRSTPGFLSFTISLSLLRLMSIESVMPSNHLILCHPLLLLLLIFPSIRIFSSELSLCIRWPKYCSFSFSISPSNEYLGSCMPRPKKKKTKGWRAEVRKGLCRNRAGSPLAEEATERCRAHCLINDQWDLNKPQWETTPYPPVSLTRTDKHSGHEQLLSPSRSPPWPGKRGQSKVCSRFLFYFFFNWSIVDLVETSFRCTT